MNYFYLQTLNTTVVPKQITELPAVVTSMSLNSQTIKLAAVDEGPHRL